MSPGRPVRAANAPAWWAAHRPNRSARLRHVAAAVVVAVVAAGCGGSAGDDGEGGTTGVAADLQGTLRRATLFDTQRAFSLTIEPRGERDLRLRTIQLSSPLFEPVRPQERDARVRATDRAVVMPLRYGEARCDADADAAEEPAAPAELVTDIDGEEVRLPLDEVPSGLLADLHGAECEVAAVREDVDIRFGDRWERIGPGTVETDLELVQRRPGVTASVDEIEGNVIFTVDTGDTVDRAGGSDPGLEVSDDQPSASAPVVIDATRCDPHAIIEYKRKYILPARVRVGDAEPVRVDVEAEGTGRRVLEDVLTACLG